MIIVTGASGRLGRATLEHLLTRVPATGLGASVREPAALTDLAERGVRVRRGDFGDPASLAHAFEGASQVLVVSAAVVGDLAVRYNTAAIDAAVRAGAERVVYTSHLGARADSAFPAMPTHAATEEHLAACGVAWASLRNGFYTSTLERYLPAALESGVLAVPEGGAFSWADHADLSEAAAVALSEPDRVDGVSAPLSGPEALDFEAVARVASAVYGRTIRYEVVGDDAYADRLRALGLPELAVTMGLGMFRAARRGDFGVVGTGLSDLVGHTPRTVAEVLTARS